MGVELEKLVSGGTIPQYVTDPTSPSAGDLWVNRSGGNDVGEAIGLLLSLTYGESVGGTYELKYYTEEGTTISTSLS